MRPSLFSAGLLVLSLVSIGLQAQNAAQAPKVFSGYIAYRCHISADSIPMPDVKPPKTVRQLNNGLMEVWADSKHFRLKLSNENAEPIDEFILDYRKRLRYRIKHARQNYSTEKLTKPAVRKPLGLQASSPQDTLIMGQACAAYTRPDSMKVLKPFRSLFLAKNWMLPPSARDTVHAKFMSLSHRLPLGLRISEVSMHYEEDQPLRIASSYTIWIWAEKFEPRSLKPEELLPPAGYKAREKKAQSLPKVRKSRVEADN